MTCQFTVGVDPKLKLTLYVGGESNDITTRTVRPTRGVACLASCAPIMRIVGILLEERD